MSLLLECVINIEVRYFDKTHGIHYQAVQMPLLIYRLLIKQVLTFRWYKPIHGHRE